MSVIRFLVLWLVRPVVMFFVLAGVLSAVQHAFLATSAGVNDGLQGVVVGLAIVGGAALLTKWAISSIWLRKGAECDAKVWGRRRNIGAVLIMGLIALAAAAGITSGRDARAAIEDLGNRTPSPADLGLQSMISGALPEIAFSNWGQALGSALVAVAVLVAATLARWIFGRFFRTQVPERVGRPGTQRGP